MRDGSRGSRSDNCLADSRRLILCINAFRLIIFLSRLLVVNASSTQTREHIEQYYLTRGTNASKQQSTGYCIYERAKGAENKKDPLEYRLPVHRLPENMQMRLSISMSTGSRRVFFGRSNALCIINSTLRRAIYIRRACATSGQVIRPPICLSAHC